MLFAVNAGSNSVSAFKVQGDKLHLTDVVSSGGGFPDSLTVHGKLLYVLNAGGAGTAQGFRIADSQLVAMPRSARILGLANSDPSNFLTSPGQIGFSPDGNVTDPPALSPATHPAGAGHSSGSTEPHLRRAEVAEPLQGRARAIWTSPRAWESTA
jgi:hypothetical protein